MNNFERDFFAVGADFDACVIEANAPLLISVKTENLASVIIYTADASNIYGTFVKGNLIRKDENYEQIKDEFIGCVKEFR